MARGRDHHADSRHHGHTASVRLVHAYPRINSHRVGHRPRGALPSFR